VWSEKPLALSLVDARTLERAAAARGLQIGCSPLSFWGEAQQSLARRIRAGAIGTVRSVSVELFCGAAENAEWNGGDARTFNHSGTLNST
jgi:predicted dehydrogenase